MKKSAFGVTKRGEPVTLYRLENKAGASVELLDYGATVRALQVPDKNGRMTDVVLGFDSIDGYEKNEAYLGAFIGRYANRIGGARFVLEENGESRAYRVTANEKNRCLHGGAQGFDKCMYEVTEEGDAFVFSRLSPDGEEGFPGNLSVRVAYRLTEENALEISYLATTDRKTVINLTNHSYFNLNGAGNILNHTLMIDAASITETDENFNITGNLLPVCGTPFDFREKKTVGRDIKNDHAQLRYGSGYDHNFVLNGQGFRRIASLEGDESGIVMDVFTDMPGVQFYAANFLAGGPVGKGGRVHENHGALCLETQNYPDAPNQKSFPCAVLSPGSVYETRTTYAFSVAKR